MSRRPMQDCQECDFRYGDLPRAQLSEELRSLADAYASPLREAEEAGLARTRPEPQVWSALEYTCHVLDVYQAQLARTRLAVEQDRPDFPPSTVSRDERVLRDRYNERDLEEVLQQLAEAGAATAEVLAGLPPESWDRTGFYHRPDPEERSVDELARKTLHEAVHHLMDIRREIATLRQRAA